MWDSNGEVASKYVKRTLTPFGEYIPLRSIASRISSLTDGVDDFVPGNQIVLHNVGQSRIAPIICYEVIDDSAVSSISKDSNFLIVQTNNATFADSGQSMQQLNISRIRAVENNKWVVSVSTTGVSAIIDNEGNVRQITKQNESSFVSGAIVLSSNESLSNNLGNWSALISVLVALFIYIRKRQNNA